MKRRFWISCFGLLLAGKVCLLAQESYLKESEDKAKAILAKSVEALGGEAFRSVRDITVSGRVYEFRKDVLYGTTLFQTSTKFPTKVRYEVGKKMEIVMINDGDKGWKIEYKNISEQTEEEVKVFQINLKHNLDYLLRFRLNEKGMRFRYLGRTHVDLDEIEEVQLIDKDEDKVELTINASTFLPVKMKFQSPAAGKRWASDDERQYFNYHTIQGVQFPFSTVRFSNGFKASEVKLDSVSINSNLPDALFTTGYKK